MVTDATIKKGYKKTELGVIPNTWEVKSIKDLASIKTGPFGTLLGANEYSSSTGVPLISVGEIRVGRFHVTENTPLVPDKVIKRLPQYILREGDIVFARKGAVDRSAVVTNVEDGWFLGSDGISARPFGGYHPRYLAFQFQSFSVQSWLMQNAVGTTMASLNQNVLGQLKIPVAPLFEQTAIATVLSDTDALIERLDKLISKKKAIKQGTMHQLLTGKRRLPGFSGKWVVQKLGEIAQFYKGKGLPKSEIDPNGKYNCIHYGELFTVYKEVIKNIVSKTNKKEDLFLSKANDILMPTSDVTPNGLATASCVKENDVILGGDVLVIRPLDNTLVGAFFAYGVRQNRNQVMQLVSGSTVYHLYGSDMKKYKFSGVVG